MFVALLVVGTLVFFVTGKDLSLRVGLLGAVVVVILWSALLTVGIIKRQLTGRRYFEFATTLALQSGIIFLLIYFLWFLLTEMLAVQALAPVPPVKTSKLTIFGGLLIGLSVLASFIAAAINRKKNSYRA